MPPDAKAKEVGEWLHKAHRDLRAAQLMMDADPPMADDAAFHCQQAVEKALKGLLIHRQIRPTKTHHIRKVGRAIADTDPDLEQLALDSDWLSPYAAEFRYPGDLDEPDVARVRRALQLARNVVARVEARVSGGA
jgi:HEPN domain-containing protein